MKPANKATSCRRVGLASRPIRWVWRSLIRRLPSTMTESQGLAVRALCYGTLLPQYGPLAQAVEHLPFNSFGCFSPRAHKYVTSNEYEAPHEVRPCGARSFDGSSWKVVDPIGRVTWHYWHNGSYSALLPVGRAMVVRTWRVLFGRQSHLLTRAGGGDPHGSVQIRIGIQDQAELGLAELSQFGGLGGSEHALAHLIR